MTICSSIIVYTCRYMIYPCHDLCPCLCRAFVPVYLFIYLYLSLVLWMYVLLRVSSCWCCCLVICQVGVLAGCVWFLSLWTVPSMPVREMVVRSIILIVGSSRRDRDVERNAFLVFS